MSDATDPTLTYDDDRSRDWTRTNVPGVLSSRWWMPKRACTLVF